MPKPIYFIETTSPRIRGAWFIETDRYQNSRAHVIGLICSGEVDPVKVLEIDEDAGTVRDVTADILDEVECQTNPDQWVDRHVAAFDRARDYRKHGV